MVVVTVSPRLTIHRLQMHGVRDPDADDEGGKDLTQHRHRDARGCREPEGPDPRARADRARRQSPNRVPEHHEHHDEQRPHSQHAEQVQVIEHQSVERAR